MRAFAFACLAVVGFACPLLVLHHGAALLPSDRGPAISAHVPRPIFGGITDGLPYPPATSSHYAYPPGLYMQQGTTAAAQGAESWYVISAFMDTRPLVFGQPGGVAIVAGGPRNQVRKGRSWIAVITSGAGVDRRRQRHIATVQCSPTHFTWFDTHPDNATHAGATIFCSDPAAWEELKRVKNEPIGLCLVSDASDLRCDPQAIVPVTLPINYPGFPTFWGDRILRGEGRARNSSATDDGAASNLGEYLEGKGEIAVCVAPVASDIYTSTFRFWLRYYKSLGVSHVYMYMRQPSKSFEDLVDDVIAERAAPYKDTQLPTIEVIPWCQQEDSTYKRCAEAGLGDGRPRLQGGFYGSAGPNFGQVLQIQDCMFRAMGRYRWVLSVDLDEYVVPHLSDAQSLPDIVSAIAKSRPAGFGVPSELRMQTAFYQNCLPACKHANAKSCEHDGYLSQPAKDAFFLRDVQQYPRPLWAAARVSRVFDPVTRSKYMFDPLSIDRVGIHFAYTTLCDRFSEHAARWLQPCTSTPYFEVTPEYVLIHHTRASAGAQAVRACSRELSNDMIDWTFANFYFGRSTSIAVKGRPAAHQIGFDAIDANADD